MANPLLNAQQKAVETAVQAALSRLFVDLERVYQATLLVNGMTPELADGFSPLGLPWAQNGTLNTDTIANKTYNFYTDSPFQRPGLFTQIRNRATNANTVVLQYWLYAVDPVTKALQDNPTMGATGGYVEPGQTLVFRTAVQAIKIGVSGALSTDMVYDMLAY